MTGLSPQGMFDPRIDGVLGILVSAPAIVRPDTAQDLSLSVKTVGGVPLPTDLITGVVTIIKVRAGVETVVVNAAACIATIGRIFYAYTFPSASWQAADEYKAVFSGQSIKVGSLLQNLPDIRCKGIVYDPAVFTNLNVPAVDSINNILERDVIGNKEDTPAGTSIMAGVKTLSDGVYYDEINGVAGTDWPIGTPEVPSNSEVDTLAIAVARKLKKIYINGTFTLPANTTTRLNFIGQPGDLGGAAAFDFDGFAADYCTFHNLGIVGEDSSPNITQFFNCLIIVYLGPVPTSSARFVDCELGSIMSAGGYIHIVNCVGQSVINLVAASSVYIFGFAGSVSLDGLAAASTDYIYGSGLVLDFAGCTAGEFNIYGDTKILNKQAAIDAGVTINDYTIQQETGQDLVDGIYYDETNGVAGIEYPTGTPGQPSNDEASVVTMLADRKLRKVYVKGQFVLPSGLSNIEFIGYNGPCLMTTGIGYGSSVHLNSKQVNNCVFRSLFLSGSGLSGTKCNCYNCYVGVSGDSLIIADFYNCVISGFGVGTDADDRCFYDCLFYSSTFNFVGLTSPNIRIYGGQGYVSITNSTNASCSVLIYGDSGLTLILAASDTAGNFEVYGNVKIINKQLAVAAGLTLKDYTNLPNDEIPISISSDNTEKTVFDLSVAGFHYTVDSMRLNFTDPVADSYTVKLYQLVNGALVVVDTQTITTPGGYYNLVDLFGLQFLAGSNIKVTVELSVAGPLAVTGSYSYRSA